MARFDWSPAEKTALSCRIITEQASENIVRAAFEYARKHDKSSVTVVEKPNVITRHPG